MELAWPGMGDRPQAACLLSSTPKRQLLPLPLYLSFFFKFFLAGKLEFSISQTQAPLTRNCHTWATTCALFTCVHAHMSTHEACVQTCSSCSHLPLSSAAPAPTDPMSLQEAKKKPQRTGTRNSSLGCFQAGSWERCTSSSGSEKLNISSEPGFIFLIRRPAQNQEVVCQCCQGSQTPLKESQVNLEVLAAAWGWQRLPEPPSPPTPFPACAACTSPHD